MSILRLWDMDPTVIDSLTDEKISADLTKELQNPKWVVIFRMAGLKRRSPGLVNCVPALAYYFCQGLPAAFTQPGDHLLAELYSNICFQHTIQADPIQRHLRRRRPRRQSRSPAQHLAHQLQRCLPVRREGMDQV